MLTPTNNNTQPQCTYEYQRIHRNSQSNGGGRHGQKRKASKARQGEEGEEADEKMGANIFKIFDRFFVAPPP